jgi:hypothetical protein
MKSEAIASDRATKADPLQTIGDRYSQIAHPVIDFRTP